MTMMEFKEQTKYALPKVVIKTDGYEVPFALYKLEDLLAKLDLATKSDAIMFALLAKFDNRQTVTSAEIYTKLCETLSELGYEKAADAYITAHKEEEIEWQKQTDPTLRLGRLQSKDPSLVHENANKDSNVFNTQRDLTAGTVGKTLGLKMMPKHVAKAHLRGDIHYHDLDYTPWSPMTNC
ncbi:MAG: anaerobic ribonucleoside-triphosphate reductase, partial [Ligilactobacillus sp.]|nr:anaerobic ribonucleoside-triphosphate reductase [Ligilactobacillus sp.]